MLARRAFLAQLAALAAALLSGGWLARLLPRSGRTRAPAADPGPPGAGGYLVPDAYAAELKRAFSDYGRPAEFEAALARFRLTARL